MIKKIGKLLLKKLGYTIQKVNNSLSGFDTNLNFTMDGALQRCVERDLNINTVIDVGASNSIWSRKCMKYISNAKYLLIEAQDAHQEELEKFKSENSNINYVIAAAGNKDGKIYFNNSDLFGGLASETPFEDNCIEVPVVSIDNEVIRRNLEPPYLIKLDTHGFEVPILEGAKKVLEQAELVIIETYNYQLTKDSLKYYEMCEYMEKIGFSPIENVDLMLRKYDNSFWQMDTFFIPSKRKEFKYNSYV